MGYLGGKLTGQNQWAFLLGDSVVLHHRLQSVCAALSSPCDCSAPLPYSAEICMCPQTTCNSTRNRNQSEPLTGNFKRITLIKLKFIVFVLCVFVCSVNRGGNCCSWAFAAFTLVKVHFSHFHFSPQFFFLLIVVTEEPMAMWLVSTHCNWHIRPCRCWQKTESSHCVEVTLTHGPLWGDFPSTEDGQFLLQNSHHSAFQPSTYNCVQRIYSVSNRAQPILWKHLPVGHPNSGSSQSSVHNRCCW